MLRQAWVKGEFLNPANRLTTRSTLSPAGPTWPAGDLLPSKDSVLREEALERDFARGAAARGVLPGTMTIFRSFLVLLLLGGLAATLAFATENQLALLPLYENAASALCADDLTAAKAAAWILATEAVRLHHDGIAGSAAAVAKADGIAGARTLFKALSTATITLAQHAKGYFILTCPMAQAEWVQSTREVANPYLGKEMLACGEVKEETKG